MLWLTKVKYDIVAATGCLTGIAHTLLFQGGPGRPPQLKSYHGW